ncbi:helix-turn-helix domain-containing protein [Catenuloplanes japonicus]|uniref:helix-turn-helix domain-containing protein n=1 Tax=Catenuloplanes japonicus TaxID=33876 RepID=UPI0012FC4C8B|nr:helix-turn-helix transcriptional regulator [Catenuloplanes japonicus]
MVKQICPHLRGFCGCEWGLYVEQPHDKQDRDLSGVEVGRTVAERLKWLFEHIRPTGDELAPGEPPGRPYSNQEIANKINNDPGIPTTISQQQISKMRRGEAEDPRMWHCAALCRVFGVDPAFFADDQAAEKVRRDLSHILQLKELGVREVALRTVLANHGLDDSEVPIVAALIKALASRRSDGAAKGVSE